MFFSVDFLKEITSTRLLIIKQIGCKTVEFVSADLKLRFLQITVIYIQNLSSIRGEIEWSEKQLKLDQLCVIKPQEEFLWSRFKCSEKYIKLMIFHFGRLSSSKAGDADVCRGALHFVAGAAEASQLCTKPELTAFTAAFCPADDAFTNRYVLCRI